MLSGKVNTVELIEHIQDHLDYCNIEIDMVLYKVFYDYGDLLNFSGKTVLYDTMYDVYKGNTITRIANLAEKKVIQTLDKVSDIKLIPSNATSRVVCNFDAETIRYGDRIPGSIGFLAGCEFKDSGKGIWYELEIVDMNAKRIFAKIFLQRNRDNTSISATIEGLVGNYIKFTLMSSTYGFQTDELELYPVDVVEPPEVIVAEEQIRQCIEQDEALMSYCRKYDFISFLKDVIDGEKGYHLVRIASEIALINSITNISELYSRNVLIRAAIASRGYLLPAKDVYSRPVINVNKVLTTELKTDRELITILDVLSKKSTVNKRMYIKISEMVLDIIKERRTAKHEMEQDYATFIDGFHVGGLL